MFNFTPFLEDKGNKVHLNHYLHPESSGSVWREGRQAGGWRLLCEWGGRAAKRCGLRGAVA